MIMRTFGFEATGPAPPPESAPLLEMTTTMPTAMTSGVTKARTSFQVASRRFFGRGRTSGAANDAPVGPAGATRRPDRRAGDQRCERAPLLHGVIVGVACCPSGAGLLCRNRRSAA